MAVTTTNLVLGPANIYVAPFATVETGVVTLASLSAAPTGTWIDVGGTEGGVQLSIAQTFAEMVADQILERGESRITGREFEISMNLAELTLANLDLALANGGSLVTAAGLNTYEPSAPSVSSGSVYNCLIIDGFAPGGKQRRIIVRKVLSLKGAEFAYTKDKQAVYKVSFTAHYVSAAVRLFKIVDAA